MTFIHDQISRLQQLSVQLSQKSRRRIAVGAIVAGLLLAGSIGAYAYLHAGLPDLTEDGTIAGLGADVDIVRDNNGVPHIFAQSWNDAYRALGYLHAQDRLLQMETTRRLGEGRLAEVMGPELLKMDKLMRLFAVKQAAYDSYNSLFESTKEALAAYADGVNAYMTNATLPLELRVLGVKPEAWQPQDSLIWGKLMSLQLSSNYREEILMARLQDKFSDSDVDQLMPAGAATSTVTLKGAPPPPPKEKAEEQAPPAATEDAVPEAKPIEKKPAKPKNTKPKKKAEIDDATWAKLAELLPEPLGPTTASNVWAVSAHNTDSGAPQLANDPHLQLGAPVLWYLARIVVPGGSLVGATVPGMPFHILGMNSNLAWGMTTTAADTQDLFVEKVTGEGKYKTPNGDETFVTRTETFNIRGQEPETMTMRQTRHGPVISDIDPTMAALLGNDKAIALQAVSLRGDDTTAEAILRLNRAKSAADFGAALHYMQGPVHNIFFAERSGSYGMQVGGLIPVRKHGDGRAPVPGDNSDYDWRGMIPFDYMPRQINPAAGYIQNANNAVVPDNYPYLITSRWEEGYRGERLDALLSDKVMRGMRTTLNDHQAILGDTYSPPAKTAVAKLAALVRSKGASAAQETVLKQLESWNGNYDVEKPEPLILEYWQRITTRRLLLDDMGDELFAAYLPMRTTTLLQLLETMPTEGNTDWCDDRTTKTHEDCADIARAALDETLATLHEKFGEPVAWQWGQAHIAPLTNRALGVLPGFIADHYSLATPVPGGTYTLNRGDHFNPPADLPFASTHGAGYRAVYDLGSPEKSRFIISTGNSGQLFSPYYGNLTPLWTQNGWINIGGTIRELEKNGGHSFVLKSK